MHASQLLQDYGYYAVFLLGLLEGETILLLGAYAVHEGYLKLVPLISCGATAAFLSDQFYFLLGRRKGAQVLERHPRMKQRFARAFRFVERHPVATVLLMRFAWGLRIAFPVALGMSRMRTAVFLPLNAVAAVAWATIVVLCGVWITQTAKALVGSLRPYEFVLIGVAAAVGLVVAIRHLRMG